MIKIAPHVQHLADLDSDTVRISSASALSKEERQKLYDLRVEAIDKKKEAERKKREDKIAAEESLEEETSEVGASTGKRKSGSGRSQRKRQCKDKPEKLLEPTELVGKRVEHTWKVIEEGSRRAQKFIYLGTVIRIVKYAENKLYTCFEIQYDIGINEDEEEDEEEDEPQTIFHLPLLVDYMDGSLELVD